MNIKEIEQKADMSRANIRYYESEGLLEPARGENGYRNYTDADLAALLRIRLLRSLQFSLEDIRALQRGEAALGDALARQLSALEAEETALARSRAVCMEMRSDGASYATLDAAKYLNALRTGPAQPAPLPPEDTLPPVRSPWRRYFARSMDYALCVGIWELLRVLVFRVNLGAHGSAFLPDVAVALVLELLLEPLFLSTLGTTPGKYLLGLFVTDPEGGRLSYRAAASRTARALWYGMGFQIPIFSLIRLVKSYRACEDLDALAWEDESVLVLRDDKVWRSLAYAAARAAMLGLLVLAVAVAGAPRHRSPLSAAEFCDNFNRYAAYYEIDLGAALLPDGSWAAEPAASDADSADDLTFVLFEAEALPRPAFRFTETDGVLTGVAFDVRCGEEFHLLPGREEMTLAILAFTRAQPGAYLGSKATNAALELVDTCAGESFSCKANGVRIVCDTAVEGYFPSGGYLWPDETAETRQYQMCFSLRAPAPAA